MAIKSLTCCSEVSVTKRKSNLSACVLTGHLIKCSLRSGRERERERLQAKQEEGSGVRAGVEVGGEAAWE